MANLYKSQKRYDEAKPLYLRALKVSEVALGLNHPNVGAILNNVANCCEAQGAFVEAESLYLRSIEIRRERLG